ncbi:MAG: DNA-formamidopyrimidine glycosylase family protein [Armatimonadota bacterium]|nr:DNA-formamidopyrimidine glycosylase family protein [Armatimonadota bacterium]MDR7538463.1 DNA-formamidopyrimidine glycosylase family protein [Armatimonadota bacterium]
MPEIPWLEALVAALRPQVSGRTIRATHLHSAALLKSVHPPLEALAGATVQDVRRRGKLLLFDLSGGLVMIVHLGRDGRLQVVPSGQRLAKDVALALALDDGNDLRLVERGPKKRAGLYLRRAEEVEGTEPLSTLGLEPLDEAFSAPVLAAMLAQAQMQLKRFLTSQRYLAGIGNAWADEILWEARLSPFALTGSLQPEEQQRLHTAIREVLQRSIEEHRARFGQTLPLREPEDLFRIHRRAGQECPRCGGRLAAVYFQERETSYCPGCQTGGKVYADRRLSRLLK